MCVGGAITTQLYYPSQATGCHSPCFVLAGPALSLFSSCTGMLGSQGARRLEVRPTWSQPRCCSPSQGADPYSPSSTSVGVRERGQGWVSTAPPPDASGPVGTCSSSLTCLFSLHPQLSLQASLGCCLLLQGFPQLHDFNAQALSLMLLCLLPGTRLLPGTPHQKM